ncbi:MAG: hypothetical protein L0Y58_04875 [Verrucomicrobia subdivision 3 bacterium]|nr:hypothetical protein [Limisphaerales bacterium]
MLVQLDHERNLHRAMAMAMSLAGHGQPAAATVRAGAAKPDAVATSLMPVPIFNFAVHNIAFSPRTSLPPIIGDGQTLATGDGTGTIRLWTVATGEMEATIAAHTNWAFSVAWSSDAQGFATAGGDDLVHLFQITDLSKPAKTFRGHANDVHAVVFSSSNDHLFSAGDDRHIIKWNLKDGTIEKRWRAHNEQIPSLALSPAGRFLASGSRDDSIRLWDAHTGKLIDTLIGHSDDVLSVRFSPDGRFLASAGYDHTVRLWHVESGRTRRIFKGHTNRVFSVDFSPNGEWLASAGDSTVRLWDVKSGAVIRVASMGGEIATATGKIPENLSAVAFSPNGEFLAVSSTTGITFLLSAQTGKLLRQYRQMEPGFVASRCKAPTSLIGKTLRLIPTATSTSPISAATG